MDRTFKDPLKKKLWIDEDQFDHILDILASAELMLDEAEKENYDFKFDYSGIIILYCKVIEILEHGKSEELETQMKEILKKMLKPEKLKPEKNTVFIPRTYWINKMIDKTKYGEKDGKPQNVFHLSKAGKSLGEFLKYGPSGDLFMYNTLLFMYYHDKKMINENFFELFRRVYCLYHKDRNGSAHTHSKNLNDAKRVRKSVIGEKDSLGSLTYSLLHEL